MKNKPLDMEKPIPAALQVVRERSKLGDYLVIARPDHWTKNLFILPGLFLAKIVSGRPLADVILPLILGMAATCLISSANYTINEWLDRHFDRFHPKKRSRPSVGGGVSAVGVYLEYVGLIVGGLTGAVLVRTVLIF